MAEGPGFSSTGREDAALPPFPRVFGRLLVLKLIARGGMGDVCLAATRGIEGAERAVIVKTVRRDHIHDGSFLARFLDEARVQSQLNHPGVAQVLEAATDEGGEPYTVVEHVEGRSLAEVRQRAVQVGHRIEWPEAVAVAIEMAQALAHVHERSGPDGAPLGIVHRDLSPQNVMIGYAGEVKLIDFGTARGHNRRCHTVAGVVFAKPGYVAPEVARQQVGDGRIDLYALGIMLWEMCKNARFFTGDPQKHLEDSAGGRVRIPTLANALDAPMLLDDVIAKLTANDPDERYASASRAVPDLARLLSAAPATPSGERGVRARIAALMTALWPHEPARSRAEFAKLLSEGRRLTKETSTPPASKVVESVASRMAPEDPNVLAGTPYRLVRTIGSGASGIVYEAEHVELGRKVALKVLAPEHGSATDAVDRFRREARAVANLSHPNLVALFDFGKSLDGRVFLAMELLKGETLDKKIKAGGFAWRDAVAIGIEVAKALEAAHGAGLVHRDLKPANLFMTEDGGTKLLDFGVAMALADTVKDAAERRQKGFAIFGTPEYMAPEQVAGEPVDARCDLYALGCVLYELVTGVRVFEGPSSIVVLGKQLRELAEPPRSRAPDRAIPMALDDVITRALSKRPADRFASATAMREALEATLAPAPRRSNGVRRAAAWLATSAVLLGAAGASARFVASKGGIAALLPSSSASAAPVAVIDPTPTPATTSTSTTTTTTTSTSTSTSDAISASLAVPTAPLELPMTRAEKNKALAESRARAKSHMSDPGALRAWAWAAFRAGELREARRAAQAWTLHDGTAEPRLFAANVLEAQGHKTQAKTVLEEYLQLHPDAANVRAELARLAGERGQIAHR